MLTRRQGWACNQNIEFRSLNNLIGKFDLRVIVYWRIGILSDLRCFDTRETNAKGRLDLAFGAYGDTFITGLLIRDLTHLNFRLPRSVKLPGLVFTQYGPAGLHHPKALLTLKKLRASQ